MLFNESYYRDPYLTDLDAKVIRCSPEGSLCGLVLSDTIFYPEGGGQPADRGFLRTENGEEIPVRDVQRNPGQEVVHFVDAPLEPGTPVHLSVDFGHRFSLMQNHTGEHIVSGLIHRAFGYENVGFHMSDVITIDLSGELSWEQAMDIEKKANAVIWKNLQVDIIFPKEGDDGLLDFRSKKELEGKIRLVSIPDTDLCACCGLHVRRTGEIGLIKLLSLMKYKGGVRIEMVCGEKALSDYESKLDSNTEIKNLLSVKPHEVTGAVKRLLDESGEKSARIAKLNLLYFDMRVRELEPEDGIIIDLEEDLDGTEIRKLCEKLKNSGRSSVSAVLCPVSGEKDSFRYVIASKDHDLKEKAPDLNRSLKGRGGGSKEMIQGSFFSPYDEICKVLRSAFSGQ